MRLKALGTKVQKAEQSVPGPGPRSWRRSTLGGIVHQLCPRCRLGPIFSGSIFWGLPKTHDRCPVCGLLFAREQGYFLGATYIAYGLALAMITLFTLAIWAVTHDSFTRDIL